MQEEPQNAPVEESPAPDALEYKPGVKYAAIGLGILLLFGVEYATYTVGYGVGYREASPSASAQASAELNAMAVQNLTHFMQLSTESDASLLDTVKNYKQRLDWIKDAKVRREAEWTLVQTLIDRGMVDKAEEMLAALFPTVPVDDVWARRSLCVADALAADGRVEDALSYYRFAAGQYAKLNRPDLELQAVSSQVEVLASAGSATQDVIVPLQALQQEASALGGKGRALQANILAYMGSLYRQSGDTAKALQCFEQALAGVDAGHTPEMASAAVCYGMALMEKGEKDKAEALLRESIARLGDTPADAAYLVAALRELAQLEVERGNADEALCLLYRAEGTATGRIPSGNPFWSQLYDQRGWINFCKQLYAPAAADFEKAAADKQHPELLAQPMEGAARCHLALGNGEKALQYLEGALLARRKYQPKAKADIGRLYLLTGNAYDLMSGHAEDAVGAYTKAVEQLPADSADRPGAMMSLGYALNQSARWADAAKIWEALLVLAGNDTAMKDEVKSQLSLCRRHGVGAPAEAADEGEAAGQPAAPASARPRNAAPARRKPNR